MAANAKVSKKDIGEAVRLSSPSRERVATPEGEAVKIELPWVALAVGEGMGVSQLVLEQYAEAVDRAIDLYMECRPLAVRSAETMADLTCQMWKVLQAAHPSPLYQWWDWEVAFHQFNEMAEELLAGGRAA